MTEAWKRGFTLIELLTVLTLLAVGAASVAPTARRMADRSAVLGARERVVRALTRGRALAVESGGSVVTVHSTPPRVRVVAGGVRIRDVVLGDRPLEVRLSGARDSLSFHFDRLGLGRFASGSVVLRHGSAEAGVVVSSYGRVRRR